MSHLLRASELGWITLPRPHAAIRVYLTRKRPRQLTVDPDPKCPISIVSSGCLSPLPSDVEVVGADGRVIKASGRFLITNESFDPYHLLLDYTPR